VRSTTYLLGDDVAGSIELAEVVLGLPGRDVQILHDSREVDTGLGPDVCVDALCNRRHQLTGSYRPNKNRLSPVLNFQESPQTDCRTVGAVVADRRQSYWWL